MYNLDSSYFDSSCANRHDIILSKKDNHFSVGYAKQDKINLYIPIQKNEKINFEWP